MMADFSVLKLRKIGCVKLAAQKQMATFIYEY